MALLIGFCLVLLLGLAHHFGILLLRRLKPNSERRRHLSVLTVFAGLLVLHTLEILGYAVAYAILLDHGGFGNLGGAFDGGWEGLVYFSGINFSTLGYTQIDTQGPIRLVSMMQALGGFMVLTWSATFIYTIWGEAWRG